MATSSAEDPQEDESDRNGCSAGDGHDDMWDDFCKNFVASSCSSSTYKKCSWRRPLPTIKVPSGEEEITDAGTSRGANADSDVVWLDILRRTADLGMISYDATPTCDVHDSSASESCSGSEDEQAAMSEDEDGAFDETGRIGNTDWCQCGCYAQMPTADECVCCREYPAAASRQPGCLTSNPNFETVCLNPGVLEVAYLMMRHYRQGGMGTTAHE
ncbi:uncharacterized protein LOC115326240 [Ixodes scapularis]|uniref:uncharacterized protein LOC115326240 n=1 Tax=Ixodes scapularis TaxID=6945 RepID=UPI001A9F2449|nr:uncharacterized protein LOC115326240 [Ixodes scapularis]